MDRALTDLIRISNMTGKDSTLVQGGGGNTSVKTEDGRYMYIKASGTALKDMNEKQGWRRLRLDAVLSVIEDQSLAKLPASQREPEVVNRLLLACDDDVTPASSCGRQERGPRPSVESHLHAFLDRCVIHLHPLVVAAYVNARNGRAQLEKLFKNPALSGLGGAGGGSCARQPVSAGPPLWVPYTDPGFMLAKRISKLIAKYQQQHGTKPAVMFLEKHGLFVTAGTPDAALRLVRKVIKLCNSKLKALRPVGRGAKGSILKAEGFGDGTTQTTPKLRLRVPPDQVVAAKAAIGEAIREATGQSLPVTYYPKNESVAAFMTRKDAAKLLATPALNPDELVYANGSAMWLENCDAKTIARKLKSQLSRRQKTAAAFVIKGLGLFVAADEKTAPLIAEMTASSLVIRMYATKFGGILALSKRQQDFINNWESEAFRKKLVSTPR